jgi:hypothetical protein
MRLVLSSLVLLLAGCASGRAGTMPVAELRGATLGLTSVTRTKATFELKNTVAAPLAYEHWMSQGPDPVPYCRDSQGRIHICASHVYVTEGDDPYVHECYLQPGASVKFQAVPTGDEQVGIKMWADGREEYLWLESWTPNKSLERARDR